MKITKSNMTVDGNSLHVSMPFAKVDKSERLVSGWATLDNIDTQKDVVLASASAKAFARARGNIREMHQPLAVGRMVDFREDEFYDPTTKKFYRGIFVTARVSKGAQDTWEKVLDGTLTGFSIGGEIKKASNKFNKDANSSVREIEDYDLTELSLVDNPANQLANIDSFAKNILTIDRNEDGSVIAKGMAVETKIENVFVCENHDEYVYTVKSEESSDCPECTSNMKTIGWIESGEDRDEKVGEVVNKFLNPADKEVASPEGGVDMGVKKNADSEETAKEVGVVNPGETFPDGEKVEDSEQVSVPLEEDKSEETEATSGEEVQKSEEPAAEVEPVDEISKRLEDLRETIREVVEKSQGETLDKVAELEKAITTAREVFENKALELEGKIDGFNTSLETHKVKLDSFERSLTKFSTAGALRKSAEVTPAAARPQKESFWAGAFSDGE